MITEILLMFAITALGLSQILDEEEGLSKPPVLSRKTGWGLRGGDPP